MKCPRRHRRRPVEPIGKSAEWYSVQTMYFVGLEVVLSFRTLAHPTAAEVSCVVLAAVGHREPMSVRCMSWKVVDQQILVHCSVRWCGRHLVVLVA